MSGLTGRQLRQIWGLVYPVLINGCKYRCEIEGSPLPLHDGAIGDVGELARENERLRIENRHLKEEREILKKATQFFAEISQ